MLELSSKGHSGTDIAKILQVDKSLVSRDIIFLRQKAQENLKSHIQDRLPEEYQRCLTSINQILKFSWRIISSNDGNNIGSREDSNGERTVTTITEKDKIRLQAAALANDCYRHIIELTTNGVVITDAIKFVQTNKEKLAAMSTNEKGNGKESKEPDYDEDEDENQLEERQEEETGEVEEETTNEVF